jgi:hypothetical protein
LKVKKREKTQSVVTLGLIKNLDTRCDMALINRLSFLFTFTQKKTSNRNSIKMLNKINKCIFFFEGITKLNAYEAAICKGKWYMATIV